MMSGVMMSAVMKRMCPPCRPPEGGLYVA